MLSRRSGSHRSEDDKYIELGKFIFTIANTYDVVNFELFIYSFTLPLCRLFDLVVVHLGCVPSVRFLYFGQAVMVRHTFLVDTPFNSDVKTTVSYVEENSDPNPPFKMERLHLTW